MQLKTLVLCALLLPIFLSAQADDPRLAPLAGSLYDLPLEMMPPMDNSSLLAAEMARRGPGIAPRFAETIEVDMNPETHGRWENLNAHTAVWRVRIASPDALSLNLGFGEYYMPPGGSLIIYSTDYRTIMGPFTPADNEVHNELWTPVLPTDELVIEVQLPVQYRDQLRLRLKSVNHDFLGFGEALSQSCNLDVICGAEDGWGIVDQYRDIIQSVGVYGFNGGTFCTGFLVNNARQDCTPFFMTASHCGVNNNNAASVVIYWNYFNSECRQPNSPASGGAGDGLLNDTNSGSIFRAGFAPSDMTLVELDDPVSETADAFFAGWTNVDSYPGDTVIAVHHPNTDEKRISFSFQQTEGDDFNGAGFDTHVRVPDWDIGTTEGGSSGSPLFDKNKRVVGQLHGGGAACGNNLSDSYGAFAVSWEGGGSNNTRLKNWLDPDNIGLVQLNGRAANACGTVAFASNAIQQLCASDEVVYNIEVNEGFSGTVSLSVANLPGSSTATFGDDTVEPGETTTLTIGNNDALPTGTYTFQLLGTDGTNNSTYDLTMLIVANAPAMPVLMAPADGADDESLLVNLDWNASAAAVSYEVEVSTNSDFSFIVQGDIGLTETEWMTSLLNSSTTYFWRVRAHNICGPGEWSATRSFSTDNVSCAQLLANDVPITISQSGSPTIQSTITIDLDVPVTSIIVRDINIQHTYVGDLSVTLTGPNNQTVILWDRAGVPASQFGCSGDDVMLSFDDAASATAADLENSCGDSPGLTGIYQPVDALSSFDGISAQGTWTLSVTDNENNDGGNLIGWTLDLCGQQNQNTNLVTIAAPSEICPADEASYELELGTDFGNNIELSVTTAPALTLMVQDLSFNASTNRLTFDLSGFSGAAGLYDIQLQVQDEDGNSNTLTLPLTVTPSPAIPDMQTPAAGATLNADQNETVFLTWLASDFADAYDYILATDEALTQVVAQGTTTDFSVGIDGLEAGNYYWRVTATNNCGDATAAIRTFGYFFVGTHDLGGYELRILPNPTAGPLYLEMPIPIPGDISVQIYSTLGQRLQSQIFRSVGTTERVDLGHLPAGTYWVEVTTGVGRLTERIVVVR